MRIIFYTVHCSGSLTHKHHTTRGSGRFNNVRTQYACVRARAKGGRGGGSGDGSGRDGCRSCRLRSSKGSRKYYYLSEIDRKSSSCGSLVFSFSYYRYDNSRNPLLPTRLPS